MWQRCPLCNGTGTVSDPLSSMTSINCPVCNGEKIISELTGLPPNRPNIKDFTKPIGENPYKQTTVEPNIWQQKPPTTLEELIKRITGSVSMLDNERTVFGPPKDKSADPNYRPFTPKDFFNMLNPKEQDEINKSDKT